MAQYSTIAELQNFIVLDSYTKNSILNEPPVGYQSEAALENELIEDLSNQAMNIFRILLLQKHY